MTQDLGCINFPRCAATSGIRRSRLLPEDVAQLAPGIASASCPVRLRIPRRLTAAKRNPIVAIFGQRLWRVSWLAPAPTSSFENDDRLPFRSVSVLLQRLWREAGVSIDLISEFFSDLRNPALLATRFTFCYSVQQPIVLNPSR